MPAAQPAGQPIRERLHAEHREVATPARLDLGARHAAEGSHIAEVLGHAQVRVQAERLGEVADEGTRVSCRPAKHFRGARGRLHHAAQDLKRGCLPGSVRADEPEDLAGRHVEVDPPDRLDGAVALRETPDLDRGAVSSVRRTGGPLAAVHEDLAVGGHARLGEARGAADLQLHADDLLHPVLAEVRVLGRER